MIVDVVGVESFDSLGRGFKIKLIALLLFDRVFLQQVLDIMKKEYFEDEAAQWIVEQIYKYFVEYKSTPPMDVMAVMVRGITIEELQKSVIETLKDAYKHSDTTDLQFIKDNAIEFCKNQELVSAVYDSIPLIKDRKYDQMRIRMNNAFKAGSDRNIGHIYKDSLEERMSELARVCVPTPWDVINDITQGGSSGGDLFVIMAPPGIGKTWALVTIGAHAMKRGLNVLHYTMELNENYVGKRYDAHLSGISGQNLKYHKEDIVKAINGVSGNLIVKYYPPKGATVNTIRAHFEKCVMTGFKPDIVIVDYADLLRSVIAMKEVRHTMENIYEDLRAFAGEYAIPVWTATQSNRSSLEQDIISGGDVAEAFSKIMVADFIMSLSRKITDKVAGTGRWHIVKNRFGPDGMTFPSKINTSMGSIQIFEESTSSGKDTKQQMDKGNLYVRKLLGKKYNELNSKNGEQKLGERVKVGPVDKLSGFEERF